MKRIEHWWCQEHGVVSTPATLTGEEHACPRCCTGEELELVLFVEAQPVIDHLNQPGRRCRAETLRLLVSPEKANA